MKKIIVLFVALVISEFSYAKTFSCRFKTLKNNDVENQTKFEWNSDYGLRFPSGALGADYFCSLISEKSVMCGVIEETQHDIEKALGYSATDENAVWLSGSIRYKIYRLDYSCEEN